MRTLPRQRRPPSGRGGGRCSCGAGRPRRTDIVHVVSCSSKRNSPNASDENFAPTRSRGFTTHSAPRHRRLSERFPVVRRLRRFRHVRSRAQIRDPAGARGPGARSHHQLARASDLPDHLLLLQRLEAWSRSVRPARVREHLLAHHGAFDTFPTEPRSNRGAVPARRVADSRIRRDRGKRVSETPSSSCASFVPVRFLAFPKSAVERRAR